MGKIKKITENELVGGTQSTDVYPVTSVKAVYDESNERLDNILNRRGVVNISTNYNADHIANVYNLEEAVSVVPQTDRVLGFIGTFLSANGWHICQYLGDSVTNWSDMTYWSTFSIKENVVYVVGMGADGESAGVSKVGDIYYNTNTKKLRQSYKIIQGVGSFVDVPYSKNVIYIIDASLYTFNGTALERVDNFQSSKQIFVGDYNIEFDYSTNKITLTLVNYVFQVLLKNGVYYQVKGVKDTFELNAGSSLYFDTNSQTIVTEIDPMTIRDSNNILLLHNSAGNLDRGYFSTKYAIDNAVLYAQRAVTIYGPWQKTVKQNGATSELDITFFNGSIIAVRIPNREIIQHIFGEDTTFTVRSGQYLYYNYFTDEIVVTSDSLPKTGPVILLAQSHRGLIVGGALLSFPHDRKVLRLTGMGSNTVEGGVSKVGDVFYNSSTKLLRVVESLPEDEDITQATLSTLPFGENTIYLVGDKQYYWNGDSLVQYLLETAFPTIVKPSEVSFTQNTQYDILQDSIVESQGVMYCLFNIPKGAKKVSAVFPKSTGGRTGITFRDENGAIIRSFVNSTVPEGTVLTVSIPSNAKDFYYTYYTNSEADSQKIPRFSGFTFTGIEDVVKELEKEVYGSSSEDYITITDINKVDGYYYSLYNKSNVPNQYYFYSTVDVPSGAISLEMRFEKSTGGAIGVEFRNEAGNAIGTFSNVTEPSGTKIKVNIPSGTTNMIFSYLNEAGVIIQHSQIFDGIVFSSKKEGLVQRVEELENSNLTPTLYLSEDTGNVLQDDLTLSELYEGYDNLCALYPKYIKRLGNLGTDSGSNEIRQYQIGFNNQFYQIGEGNYPEKSANNLWSTLPLYNKILVNAGTHGDEKAPCWATMLAIKDLIESTNEWAMYIKSNATILLCPSLNPTGFQNRTRANANGVDINRDITELTQPESQAWKAWIDANTDAIAYIDMHGVDFYTPFLEFNGDNNVKLYSHIAFRMASQFKSNWDKVFGERSWSRPYLLRSTYLGTTIVYTSSIGLKGLIVETPCDVINNQYNPAPNYFKSYSKSNKMTKDMLMSILRFFIENQTYN